MLGESQAAAGVSSAQPCVTAVLCPCRRWTQPSTAAIVEVRLSARRVRAPGVPHQGQGRGGREVGGGAAVAAHAGPAPFSRRVHFLRSLARDAALLCLRRCLAPAAAAGQGQCLGTGPGTRWFLGRPKSGKLTVMTNVPVRRRGVRGHCLPIAQERRHREHKLDHPYARWARPPWPAATPFKSFALKLCSSMAAALAACAESWGVCVVRHASWRAPAGRGCGAGQTNWGFSQGWQRLGLGHQ